MCVSSNISTKERKLDSSSRRDPVSCLTVVVHDAAKQLASLLFRCCRLILLSNVGWLAGWLTGGIPERKGKIWKVATAHAR